jgi:hypothetical protein
MKKFSIKSLRQAAVKRPPGYLEEVLGAGVQEGEFVYVSDETYATLSAKYSPPQGGVGTELKALLSKIGIKSSPTCSCNKRAKIMDENGIEWCEQNVKTICDWLAEESAKRKLPFVRLAGKAIINMAIRRAKKGNNK